MKKNKNIELTYILDEVLSKGTKKTGYTIHIEGCFINIDTKKKYIIIAGKENILSSFKVTKS